MNGSKLYLIGLGLFCLEAANVKANPFALELTSKIVESMEIEPLDQGPLVHVEVGWKAATEYEPDQVVILDSDAKIAEQLMLDWGAEIHCQHRIKSLEVDHPSHIDADQYFELGDAVYSTLTQSLPTQSPFKQGLVGTFKAQSYQVEDIKQTCIDKVASGEFDLDADYPQSFIIDPGNWDGGTHRLFLRGQCSNLDGTVTTAFDQPSGTGDQPNGIPFSPPAAEVVCHGGGYVPLKLDTKTLFDTAASTDAIQQVYIAPQ